MKKLIKIFLIAGLSMSSVLIAGCGFHKPTAADLAPQYRTLYFSAENPDNPLSVALYRRLHSAGVILVNNPDSAANTLQLNNIKFSVNIPTLFNSASAYTYVYSLAAQVGVSNRKGRWLIPLHNITLTDARLYNANQFYSPSSNDLIKTILIHNMVNTIYYSLLMDNHVVPHA